ATDASCTRPAPGAGCASTGSTDPTGGPTTAAPSGSFEVLRRVYITECAGNFLALLHAALTESEPAGAPRPSPSRPAHQSRQRVTKPDQRTGRRASRPGSCLLFCLLALAASPALAQDAASIGGTATALQANAIAAVVPA